ncbi:hypothetical protein EF888_12880 [Silicimonas algicola]|uniref:Uncharacterized protein n=1 Tax=Silicimonas algicola TaxID=1826607 RepID=A0A316G9L6_9RHOB|nr:hypothetical protein [Silicimonas algicola]AZQ67948.1 hypothetical protein EF888_12880 [Silicimonas algicola]PWK57611.1 hypothetical protein C8D95_102256 [Silicimonas algicola]
MDKDDKPHGFASKRDIAMVARATIELFGNGAIAKRRERLSEVKEGGNVQSIEYWQLLLEEVERLHRRRHKY